MPVMSLVSAKIAPERREEVTRPYSEMLASGLPAAIRQTFLLVSEDGTMAIATVWNSWEDLDAIRTSGEEPFARRVLREAGGEPQPSFFEIAAESRSDSH